MIMQFIEKYGIMILTTATGTLGYCLNVNTKMDKIIMGVLAGCCPLFFIVCAQRQECRFCCRI